MQRIAASKIATGFGVIGLALCLAAAPALAKKGGGGGGGGHGGGGHGGGGHGGGGHAGGAHFGGGHAVHAARVGHVGHAARGAFHSHIGSTAHVTTSSAHALATGHTAFAHTAAAGPRSFAAHRAFAHDPAFHGFWGHGWHPYNHLGWIGPLFWPYAYGDFFYCSLWPGDYCGYDPFWAYGYGDIYAGIFSPYSYEDYVTGPGAPARMASLTQSMAQSCDQEAAEVTGWPIDQIQAAVQPSPQQSTLLDDLGNAIVMASHEVKMHCPTNIAFTPTARLATMQQRLQTLVDAVNIVSPPLAKFYDSLSDEQKARFNDIAPRAAATGTPGQEASPSPQAQCNASVMAWPSDQIDRAVGPSDAQRVKLNALQSATAQAADLIKASCPTEQPPTPPSRLEAAGKRLQIMLQAVQTVEPVLTDFYDSLSDDQKARFNTMGKQLFAENQQ